MSAIPRKVMVFNLDSAMASSVYEWARCGLLPAFGRLMEKGVHGTNCLPCYPTLAAPNWASVATGAWPGTHGITDGVVPGKEMAGEPLPFDLAHQLAETLWRAGRRGGRECILLQWPSPWDTTAALGENPAASDEPDAENLLETVAPHLAAAIGDIRMALAGPWEVCFITLELLDGFYRRISRGETGKSKAKGSARTEDIELKLYQSIDRVLGEVLGLVGEEALVAVVSAHGIKPVGRPVEVASILQQAGLMAYLPGAAGDAPRIDWSRTQVVPWGSAHIAVNLKGRNFGGIVEPGEQYEAAVQATIDVLHCYTDPGTGIKPISLALRAEDARIIGLYGDRIGDVVYALDPRFGPEWGSQLPASRFDAGDMRGLFLMAGPGLRGGVSIDRNVWPTDIVPTICYLAELPIPRDCEGCVLYQALEEPDAKADELATLRDELAGLKLIVERPGMMC